MAGKIYTKTGDAGETSLFGGKRLSKDHLRIESYGTVDELNAHIGYLRELTKHDPTLQTLHIIQNKLFNIGSQLAMDPEADFELPTVTSEDVEMLEQQIDHMDSEMPELKNFILPSGNPQGAYAHVARTVCRRAERRVVGLGQNADVDAVIIKYLNRLSDYFFSLSRYLVFLEGGEITKWDPDI